LVEQIREKRDELNERCRNSRSEVSDLRDRRDSLNEEVKNLKLLRTELKEDRRGEVERARKFREKSKILARNRPDASHASLQKKVDEIDWKIQTTSLSIEEERKLVKEIAGIETSLGIHRKYEKQISEVRNVQNRISELQIKGDELHQKLTEKANKSQELHQSMVKKFEALKKLKAESDAVHSLLVEGLEKRQLIQSKMVDIQSQLQQLRQESRIKEKETRQVSMENLRSKLEKEAKQKLNRGEKLTLQELQLLDENNDDQD